MTTADSLFVELQAALAGEYSLERELGRGGMGVVYLASDVRLAREVAIKVLPPELASSRERREQFVREAQMAARLSHPNIVAIHRVDEARGFVYFVMAYIAGETLAARIAERGPLPPHQAARMLRETAWALTYAHASGLVHRDIKADNILLERATGRAVVTDFGIAGATHDAARTSDGQITGSPHYVSPEQIAGQPLDAASDLYSLGVVGFLALTGRLPFDAPTVPALLAMHLGARPPSITTLAPAVPPRLAQLVEQCLAKTPTLRPPSASALADALEHVIEPPREIPAPIRVWLARSTRGNVARGFAAAYLFVGTGSLFAVRAGSPFLVVPIALAVGASFFLVPAVYRMHHVLAAGYGIEDLRIALRAHWARRREEETYELTTTGGRLAMRTTLAVLGVSVAATAALGFAASAGQAAWAGPLMGLASAVTVTSGAFALVRFIRRAKSHRLGARQMKFYDSKWGERFVKLAGLGIKKRAPAESLAKFTEVALGRATDALYAALPKETRKHLAGLPETVRRLERDARALRAEIEQIDASLIALDADAATVSSTTGADASRDARLRDDRDRLRTDLRQTRDRAADRLAATVAALENIRLDLLRLQLGDARVESVTASLEAAQQVAADLGALVDAGDEVERSLRSPRPDPRASHP